jgi:hypothetical protein
MTSIYKEVREIKEVVREEFVTCICDGCGRDLEKYYGQKGYNTRNFELEYTSGTSYPGPSGNEEGWKIEDLCDECVERLRKLLVDNGFQITLVDRDW